MFEEVEIESYDNIQAALRFKTQEELNTEIMNFAAMFSENILKFLIYPQTTFGKKKN